MILYASAAHRAALPRWTDGPWSREALTWAFDNDEHPSNYLRSPRTTTPALPLIAAYLEGQSLTAADRVRASLIPAYLEGYVTARAEGQSLTAADRVRASMEAGHIPSDKDYLELLSLCCTGMPEAERKELEEEAKADLLKAREKKNTEALASSLSQLLPVGFLPVPDSM